MDKINDAQPVWGGIFLFVSLSSVSAVFTLLLTISIPAVFSEPEFPLLVQFPLLTCLCLSLPPSPSAKATTLFRKNTKTIVWGMQTRAVQGMLDFDYVCSREEPSVAAMVYPFT